MAEEAVEAKAAKAPRLTESSADTVVRWSETRNLLLIARLVTLAALHREESRGAHYRDDHPISTLEWQRHQTLTVDELDEA